MIVFPCMKTAVLPALLLAFVAAATAPAGTQGAVSEGQKLAGTMGLGLSESIEMPANNLILVFARSPSAAGAWPTPARSG